ncbi:coiled-coil domain-containing protein 62 [Electrophorus electricus]|uniref:Coiled-coil domain containing 62 n=1 Tax=Electrophorus electricus TaxID=8005 RepID=A0A4W4HAX3_ELEEL|nr:coiled-coil domain-containing protein 62 [Electrophorus electricus]
MDEEDRETCRNRRAPRYRDAPEMKAGFPFEPWHSTPVKKHTHDVSMARQTVRNPQMSCNHVSSLSHMEESKIPACEMEMVTIQKQRLELQLLMAELKDRDQELNDMAAAHQRQLQAWEQDRQRVLTLEQRCANLQDDLQTRNEVIRAISKHLKTVEAQEKDRHRELTSAQQQLHELSQRQQHSSQQQRDLEEKNRSMNSTIMTLSSQVGQLQVQEEELSSMLKLKDKDVMEATSRILGLTGQMREYDATRKESETRESKILSEMEEYKHRFREARYDATRLKDELQEKTIENNSQREELIRLKQENQLLRKELQLAGESWKDELLGLARSKQERTVSELLCLRQVCANQQNDLQLLKLNLETTREALRRYEGQRSLESPGSVTCLYMDCSTPSPQRRSPGPTEDAVFNIIANGNQEECVSSTSRLQRLLAESRQMVASLEHTSGKPLSPALSPAPKSDSVCSLHGSYNNSNSCNHSLSPRNSQRESQQSNDDTQNQSQHSNPRTEECGQ